LHDGLQEWMRPDAEFDCEEKDRKADGKCDVEIFNTKVNKHPWYSGYTLIDSIQRHTRIRTMLLGHTHYNSIEMLQAGQRMIPNEVTLEADSVEERNENEVANPLRALAIFHEKDDSGKDPNAGKPYDPKSIANQGITKDAEGRLTVDLAKAGHAFSNCELRKACNLQAPEGKQRELAIVRLTSAALLTSQVDNKSREPMYGFATFAVTPRQGYDAPQINTIKFFRNDGRGFEEVLEQRLDRGATFGNYLYDDRGRVTSTPDPKNPLKSVFSMKK
jgi:hypothetical protein